MVIYHYTICGVKWDPRFFKKIQKKWQPLRSLRGYKVAIPQDEYVHSEAMCDFFSDFGIKTVFTCLPESEWQKVYPKKRSGLDHYVTVFTGYIDEIALERISRFEAIERSIDIGYRARKVPFWLGRHGQIKWLLAEKFLKAAEGRDMKLDISTDAKDVILGEDWYRFLYKCRTVLGCEGGASLHDPDGKIRNSVDKFLLDHPDATFDEVEQKCFLGKAGNLKLFALSPRHFECCMTRTCQVLVEGEYGGIFKPGVHYIEIKKDWSNLDDVLNRIEDREYCRQIAENAYRDIALSGLYTYRKFVESVLLDVKTVSAAHDSGTRDKVSFYELFLSAREKYSDRLLFPSFLISAIKLELRASLKKRGLFGYYEKLKYRRAGR